MMRSGQYVPNLRHPYRCDDMSLQIEAGDRIGGLWPAVLAAVLPESTQAPHRSGWMAHTVALPANVNLYIHAEPINLTMYTCSASVVGFSNINFTDPIYAVR